MIGTGFLTTGAPRRQAQAGARGWRLGLALTAALFLAGCDSAEERIARHIEKGRELVEDGELGKALLEFRSALQIESDTLPAHLEMARIYERQGEGNRAFGHYTKVTELDPKNAEAQVKVASFLLVGGDPEGADRAARAALAIEPENPEAIAIAGAIALRAGERDEAETLAAEALAIDPTNRVALATRIGVAAADGRLEEAIALADAALERRPDDRSIHRLRLGLLQQRGDVQGIGQQLRDMIGVFPDDLTIRQALVLWATENSTPKEVEEQLRALVDADPGAVAAVFDLVRYVRQQRGDVAGRETLVAEIEKGGNTAELQLMLAQYDLDTGETDRAMALLTTLAEGVDATSANRARMALARIHAADGDTAAADAEVARVLEADPKNVPAIRMRVARLIETGALDEAIRMVRAGLEEAPEDVPLKLLEAQAQERIGNIDLASDRYASAVRFSDYAPATVQRYVAFLSRVSRPRAAEQVLTEAVDRHPASVLVLDLLANARIALEDWSGATQVVRRLQPLAPDRARELLVTILIGEQRFDEGKEVIGDRLAGEQGARSLTVVVAGLVRAGDTEEAALLLDGVIAEAPENLQAIGLRGRLHARMGDLEAAEAQYRQILELDPDNATAHAALSELKAGRDDLAGAEAVIREGLAVSPENVLLRARLAQYDELQGDYAAAIETYEGLLAEAPDSLFVANNLASLLAEHRADDPAAVDRAFTVASRLRTSPNPAYLDTFAWTRHLKGEHGAAMRILAPLAADQPDNPWLRYHLGAVYAALDRPAEARTEFEAALAAAEGTRFPHADEVTAALANLPTE